MKKSEKNLVAVVMGSQSDWETMKDTEKVLNELNINNECKIISAHRTPNRMNQFAKNAQEKGFKVIIAGAGGAAHLPGMIASHTNIPVIGVPINSTSLDGLDSLLSIVQMPKGIPVASMSIGNSGAINAAVFAAEVLSLEDKKIAKSLLNWKKLLSKNVPLSPKD